MIHTSLWRKDKIDAALWPIANTYAAYIYNCMPNENGIAPAEFVSEIQFLVNKLKVIYRSGYPIYVQDCAI